MSSTLQCVKSLRWWGLAAVVIAAGCATQPPSDNSSQAAPQAAGSSTASETPAPASQVVKETKLADQARLAGYTVSIRNGVATYCTNDADIGSRIPTTKCLNEAQMQQVLRTRAEEQEQMQNAAAPICGSGQQAGC